MSLKIVHHHDYQATLRTGHRFPMGKYRALANELVDTGLVAFDQFYRPALAPTDWFSLAHDRSYVDQVFCGAVSADISKEIGFDVNDSVAKRARLASAGTVLAARLALVDGIAANTAGGSHHANSRHGAGFCVFNDVAIAARVLLADGEIGSAMVFDCDVHQGDGTAQIFNGDPSVFTVSLHGQNNYPSNKMTSDLDFGLADKTDGPDYMPALDRALATSWSLHQPDIVFYNAGIDPHMDDALGRLCLNEADLRERDHRVISFFRSRNVPVACVIGGGYSRDVEALAKRHAIVFNVAAQFVD